MGRADLRRWEILGLILYSALLAAILLSPSAGPQSSAVGWFAGGWIATDRAEFVCNALILIPVSALGALIWPRSTWRDWTAWIFLVACSAELAQALLLSERSPSYTDVVANTLGGMLGALTIAVLSRLRTAAGTPPTTPG